MQTATSEMESKSRYLSICVHHYTLRAPCPKGQGQKTLDYSATLNRLPGCLNIKEGENYTGNWLECSIRRLSPHGNDAPPKQAIAPRWIGVLSLLGTQVVCPPEKGPRGVTPASCTHLLVESRRSDSAAGPGEGNNAQTRANPYARARGTTLLHAIVDGRDEPRQRLLEPERRVLWPVPVQTDELKANGFA